MSRLVRWGPRAARVSERAVLASQASRSFSDSTTTEAAAPAAEAPAADANEFKVSSRSVDARKTRMQLADEALYRTPMGERVERLRKYTGLVSDESAVDPVLKETIRRTETAAAHADMKKKAEWDKILASSASTDAKAKKLIAAGAPSHVVLNTLHYGKPRVHLGRTDRGNTDSQDYAALARDRFMEEFDASSYDYENSSDPEVLPRQRPFTRDEMHRILQDVEATRSKDASRAYEEQLMLPTSLVLHLAENVTNINLVHDAANASLGDMTSVLENPALLADSIRDLHKKTAAAAEIERRRVVDEAATKVLPAGSVKATTEEGIAALYGGVHGASSTGSGVRTGAPVSAEHVAPAAGVAGAAGLADSVALAGSRHRGLTTADDMSSLPISAPSAHANPRTPFGTVSRPFANIFEEAANRVRETTINGLLDPSRAPLALRGETMGEAAGDGVEFPYPNSAEAKEAWEKSRPPGLSAEDDPMVRRVSPDEDGFKGADASLELPEGLSEATTYRQAVAMLLQPKYRDFVEKLSGLSREEQIARVTPLAQMFTTALKASKNNFDAAEDARATRRALEAKRAAEHGVEWKDFAEQERDGDKKEESETVVLLREVNEFLADYRPVSGIDPNPDNDFRFGSAVRPFPVGTTIADVEETLYSIAEQDRFAAYYQQPQVAPTGEVEHLKMDQGLASFNEVQLSEFRKAARKRNDPKVLQSLGSNRLRRFRKGMELYSGLPEHLLDYIDFHALPANDPRRLTHPLAVKLQRQIDELRAKAAPAEPEHSVGGAVAVHSDAELADAGADGIPLSLVRATKKARELAALEAKGLSPREAAEAALEPATETDLEIRIATTVNHVLGEKHFDFYGFDSGFESEINFRHSLLAGNDPKGDGDVRLVDATDGEVEPGSSAVSSLVPLVAKIYGRESRLNAEIAAVLSTLPAAQQAAVASLFAANPAAAKRAVQQSVDRYTILAAIGSGSIDVPQDLLLERGLGRLKALIPPQIDFIAAAKAANSVASDKAAAGAPGSGVATSVLGSEAGAKADANSAPALLDGSDALSPVLPSDNVTSTKGDGVFTNAIRRATEAARLEQVRKMLSARGLDSTGVRQRQRAAEQAARTEALNAVAQVEAARAEAQLDGDGGQRNIRDPNLKLIGTTPLPLEYFARRDPLVEEANENWGKEPRFRTFDAPLRPVPRAELGDNDPLARTLQDPVEYLPDHLAPAQLRTLYNNVEERIERAFFKNELSERDWTVMYQAVRAREIAANMDNSDSEERDMALFRREIVTGAVENSREQIAQRHQLAEHDTIINDYDISRHDEVDDSRLHRASRLLSPYEMLPVTDAAIPPFIAIEQQTHIYNLHKLDPSTFHPRWIAKRLNITPAAVVAMLKAQDLVHKSHLPNRSAETGMPQLSDCDDENSDGLDNPTEKEEYDSFVDVKDERVLYPRTLDDLQIPYPPEQLLGPSDVEGDLQLDAPHLIGRVSFDDDIFRDPAWQSEAFAPVRLVTDPEVAARTVEREEDRLNRLWARKDTIADAVEKASFAKFGPVHWASGQRTLHRPPKLPREIISRDLQPPSKHNWVLTATDENFRSTFSIMVRDRDGYLRHPTFREFNAVRLRERDRRLPFFWRRHKVLAKLPEISSAYVDQVMNAMLRTDGASKFGANVRTIMEGSDIERDVLSEAERDLDKGIDLGEMAHVLRLVDYEFAKDATQSESDIGEYNGDTDFGPSDAESKAAAERSE